MIGPMTLLELIEQLDSLPEYLTVLRWSDDDLEPDAEVFVIDLDEEEPSNDKLKEFLDIAYISDIIRGKSIMTGSPASSAASKLKLLLDYVENDA